MIRSMFLVPLLSEITSTPSPGPEVITTASTNLDILTMLVSIFGALVGGGLVSAVFTSRQQRIHDLREALLAAAESLLAAVSDALSACRALEPRQDTRGLVVRTALPLEDREQSRDLQLQSIRDAKANLAAASVSLRRLQLIYGPKSATSLQGSRVLASLVTAVSSITTYYSLEENPVSEAAGDSVRRAIERGGDVFTSILPGKKLEIALGSTLARGLQEVLQQKSVNTLRSKSLKFYQESAALATDTLEAFVDLAWRRVADLQRFRLRPRRDRWVVGPDEQIRLVIPDGGTD